jgi:ADP-heptose:LPS heptosyltransferase
VAGIITELDLLITVDTGLAHLAGALGVPVWTLISHVPDWRWMLDREDTDWYASMRLFRQSEIGNWSGVIDHVRCRMSRLN